MRTTELDLRDVSVHMRRRALLLRFDQLRPGDSLVIVSDTHPLPLMHWLLTARFSSFSGRFLAQTPNWRVEITRRHSLPGEPPVHDRIHAASITSD